MEHTSQKMCSMERPILNSETSATTAQGVTKELSNTGGEAQSCPYLIIYYCRKFTVLNWVCSRYFFSFIKSSTDLFPLGLCIDNSMSLQGSRSCEIQSALLPPDIGKKAKHYTPCFLFLIYRNMGCSSCVSNKMETKFTDNLKTQYNLSTIMCIHSRKCVNFLSVSIPFLRLENYSVL